MPSSPAATLARPSLRRDVWCALAVIVLAAAVRGPRLSQSLWLDEMTTLVSYALQPWSKVLAAGAGQYVPNNHVLHTAAAKLLYTAVAGGRAAAERGAPPQEAVLRLPAWAAASLLPVALAWPLRRRAPRAALAVAVLAALNPWLVVLGSEARGYTLMLLLAAVATNLLPANCRVGYAAVLAAAIYTIPLAVLLVPAHAVAVGMIRPAAFRRWAIAAAAGLLLAALLYLPMARGVVSYYRHPYPPTMTYGQMLNGLPRFAVAGQGYPRHAGPAGFAVFWLVPVVTVTAGSLVGWSRFPDARPQVATLAAVTGLGLLLPLVVPGATEVRFDTWAAPWFCVAAGLLLAAMVIARPALAQAGAATGMALLLAAWTVWDADLLPNQPIREAMRLADRLVPPGRPIAVVALGAYETVFCYAGEAPDHLVLPAPDAATLNRIGSVAGRPAWVVISFEDLTRERAPADPDLHGLWQVLCKSYRPAARLPGRVSPVAVYAPVGD